MALNNSFNEEDSIAWQALQDWLSQDEEGQAILTSLRSGEQFKTLFLQWVEARRAEAPPQLSTHVSGGQVGKLINIAHLGVLQLEEHKRYKSDAEKQSVNHLDNLLNEMKSSVARWRTDCLHKSVRLNLLMEEQPYQVRRPEGNSKLSPGTSIRNFFGQEEIAGKLLILGELGSGKTATLMQLAEELITCIKNKPSEPIPVLFNLSSWKDRKRRKVDKQSIASWLVSELNYMYGVPGDIGRQWLKNQQLLLLLDGLDELPFTSQERCIKAINAFLKGNHRPKYLVVCSNRIEYKNFNSKLELNGAVYLQPLNEAQIQDYLLRVERPELWQSIASSNGLLDLVESPLMLYFLVDAYKGEKISLEQLNNLNSELSRRNYLFNYWIEKKLELTRDSTGILRVYYSPGKIPTSKQIEYWLIWLAKMLKSHDKTVFLIEEMQPSWLQDSNERLTYRIVVWLIVGLIIGVFGGLIGDTINAIIGGLIGAIIGGVSGTIIGIFREKISPVETLRRPSIKNISLNSLKDMLRSVGLGEGLIFSLISQLGISDSRNFSQISELIRLSLSRVDGLIGGLVGGPMGALIRALSGPEEDEEKKVDANQGIWKSGIYAVLFALIFGLMFGLIGWLIAELVQPSKGLIVGKFFGLMGGLIAGLVPGIACIQHFVLRVILWSSGCIPWNYARFLNYAKQLKFLQTVGGRYRFIHPSLQEYLAERLLINN